MTYSITLTIGHNINDRPTFTTSEICDFVTDYLNVEAFTAFECAGMWRGMREDSTRIEISALSLDQAEEIRANVPVLAQALNQQAIMCEIRPDRVEFIEREVINAQTA